MNRTEAKNVNDAIIKALGEHQRNRQEDFDAKVLKAVTTKLNSFGIDEEERSELRADLSTYGGGVETLSRPRAIYSRQ